MAEDDTAGNIFLLFFIIGDLEVKCKSSRPTDRLLRGVYPEFIEGLAMTISLNQKSTTLEVVLFAGSDIKKPPSM